MPHVSKRLNSSSRFATLRATLLAAFCLGTVLAAPVRADALADLKGALARLQGQTPLKALVEVNTKNRSGDGKDLEESQGRAAVTVEDSARGLQVLYSHDLMTRLENEEYAKEKDPKAKTPTVTALREFSSSELRPMVSGAAALLRRMEKAVFKGEKAQDYNGKPARLLSFEIPIETLGEKERKYIKKFEGLLEIWIGNDGTPLASRSLTNIAGRALVVISFETKTEDQSVYGLAGDRLIMLRKESRNSGSGAGEKGESHTVKTLQLQS